MEPVAMSRRKPPRRGTAAGRESKSEAVRQWLLGQITAGAFGREKRLPSESDLMARFGVSRVTVRHALDELRQAGVIEGRQGKGYFVRHLCAVHDLTRLQGFGEMMAPLGVEVRSQVLDVGEVAAKPDVAKALGLGRGDPVTRIRRLRIAGGMTLSYDVSYFPVDIGRALQGLDLARADIFRLLEDELKVELGYADLMLELVADEPEPCRRLGMAEGESPIRMIRLTRDMDGRPVDFEYLFCRPDAFQFRVRVPRC